ncbi:hypothetical protein [Anditalea andensis]|uniref:Deoxynucleoside kinase domain-containing protein n=1 Tax=Anditalea andensis TaxID=1048983 RepID=A0A074KX76_9BACT|nr:hypothetical protein [Anditalea andensis]KEO72203.1 hypothetical protein EL17_20065 [Anditalea andensis]
MAKWIEICGTNGVGKSTIVDNLKKIRKKDSIWTISDYLYPRLKISRTSLKGYVLSSYRYYFKDYIDPAPLREARFRMIENNKEFIDLFLNILINDKKFAYNNTDFRFENISYFSRVVERVQYIKEAASDKFVILDEGFLHHIGRLVNKHDHTKDEKEDLSRILNITPLPDAIIYLDLEVNENAKRLINRNKNPKMLKTLQYHEIMDFLILSRKRRRIINDILSQRGIPILYLDTSNNQADNLNLINAFIDDLKRNDTAI